MWSSTSDATFSNGANWTGGIAPPDSLTTNSANFNGASLVDPVVTTSQSVAFLDFFNKNFTLSSTGGAVLTLGALGIRESGNFDLTVNMDIVLGADQTWFSQNAGRSLTMNGNVSGGFSFSKTGNGTVLLSGTNTYTGTTTVSAGILLIGKTSALYNGDTASWTAGKLIVNSGTTLAFRVGGSGEFTTGNVTTLLTNLSTVNNNGLLLGSSIGFDTTNASGGTFTVADTIANSTGTGSGLVGVNKLGSGTLVLTGANTYTGKTVISAGTLSVSSIGNRSVTSSLGAPSTAPNATISIGSNTTDGTLLYTGGTASTNRVINLAGSTGGATLDSSGTGALTFTANFTATSSGNKTLTLTGSTTGNTITGAVVNATTGATALTKSGSGSWILSGANTYSGGTTVSAGTLTLGSATTLQGATGTLVVSGGTLATSVTATTIGGSLTLSSGAITPNGTSAGSLTLASGKTFTMSGGTLNLTLGSSFDQIISAGSGTLSFTGGTISFDTTGAGFSYASAYQIFNGFGSTSFSSLALTGYDTSNYVAAVSNAGLLSFSPAAIPEPSTYAVCVGGLVLGFAAWRRRRAQGVAPAGLNAVAK